MTPEKIQEVFFKIEKIINDNWPSDMGYAPYKFCEYGEEKDWLIRFDNVNYITYNKDTDMFTLDLNATFEESDDFWGITNYKEKEIADYKEKEISELYKKVKELVEFVAKRIKEVK